jgi:O-antigen ligase
MLYDQMVETEAMHPQAGGDILSEDGNPLIPGHSQIVTAWVWAGIAGLIFWLYMVVFFFKAMVRIALLRPPMAPAYMSFLIAMWWDIFFSPFAANRRIIESFMIIFAADLSKNKFIIVQDSWRRLGAVVASGRLQRRISGSSAPSR